ncbi:MAG: CHASE3 domain-containing protein [Bacteroidetes bacterium]|nr:CHASE3 domain-containing protein [Bacteroidota bacterium]
MKLATQIFLGFMIAISIDLLDSVVNYMLTLRVKQVSEFLNRSEAVIRYSANLNKDMIGMESAFRGFLLTGDKKFLVVYDEGLKSIPERGRQLDPLISLPEQRRVLDSIMVLHGHWVDFANGIIKSGKKTVPGVRMVADLEYYQRISLLFDSFNKAEYGLRDIRRKEQSEAIARTDRYSLMSSLLLVLVGLGTALWLVRRISGRIRPLVRLAERISQGDFSRVEDDKRDELSSLSHSLNLMSDKLSQTISELEKKNQELNQFAYVVSHDLKAPVRGISNVIKWIEEDHGSEIGPTVRKYLDFIPDRVNRMEALIDGMLEYARAGREGALKEAVDVEKLVGELADLIVPDGYIIRTERLPVVFTERLTLQQVLSNLIGNAVKYGRAGATVITVGAVDYGAHYEFWVEDNGPGIPAQYHEKIFGMFRTLREKADKESTGIGLSIVRKIVEERGGSIRLVSSPGNGAKFFFTWLKNI